MATMNTRPAHRSRTFFVAMSGLLLATGCASLPPNLLLAGGAVYLAAGLDLSGADHREGSPSHLSAQTAADDCVFLLVHGDMAGVDCRVTGRWDASRGAFCFDYLFESPEDPEFSVRFAIAAEPWGPARVDARFADDRTIACVGGTLTGPAVNIGPCTAMRIATWSTHVQGMYSTSVLLVADTDTGLPVWRVTRSQNFERMTYICEVDAATGSVLREHRHPFPMRGIRLLDNDV